MCILFSEDGIFVCQVMFLESYNRDSSEFVKRGFVEDVFAPSQIDECSILD